MNKKWFTLVELLAVIVILAIIALISTPIILGVIDKAKKGAAEQSALGYIDAVEKQIVYNQVKENQTEIVDGPYTVEELEKLGVNVKGTVPRGDKDKIIIDKGKVKSATLTLGDYNVEVDDTGKATATKTGAKEEEKYTVYANGTAIYYNPETNKKCSESEANKNVNENGTPTGIKTGCMKWYTFNDEGEKTGKVNMILEHNTTATVAWNSTGSNSEMKEVASQLQEDTKTWDSSLNARLITANEVAKITDNKNFDGSTLFYFDSNNQTQTATSKGASKYAWLFDYTKECTSYGCNIADSSNYGYWTSTPTASNSSRVCSVNRSGDLDGNLVGRTYRGVRPVITVSKSVIS